MRDVLYFQAARDPEEVGAVEPAVAEDAPAPLGELLDEAFLVIGEVLVFLDVAV